MIFPDLPEFYTRGIGIHEKLVVVGATPNMAVRGSGTFSDVDAVWWSGTGL